MVSFIEKVVGDWENDGDCVAEGPDKTCGPGSQKQTRDCTDGAPDLCEEDDRENVELSPSISNHDWLQFDYLYF